MNQIDDYLKNRIRKKRSRWTYKSYLNAFFKSINKSPDDYLIDLDEIERDKRFAKIKAYTNDLRLFAKNIAEKPPKTQSSMIYTVKGFFRYYGVELKQNVWYDILNMNGIMNPRPITPKKTPTCHDLKYILENASIKHKAFFLFIATTGMRINEACSIHINDVDLETNTVTIRDVITKKGYSRTTFFTDEAKYYLERWLEERDDFLVHAYQSSGFVRKQYKQKGITENKDMFKSEKRLFPFSNTSGRTMWYNLLEQAGDPFNEKTNDSRLKHQRYFYNEHCLRRFFQTMLETSRMDSRFIDYMIGHADRLMTTYTDDNLYRETVRKAYKEHESHLTIFSDANKIKSTLEPKIDMQDRYITKLRNENAMLEQRIDELEQKMERDNKTIYQQHDTKEQQHYTIESQQKEIDELKYQIKTLVKLLKQKGVTN